MISPEEARQLMICHFFENTDEGKTCIKFLDHKVKEAAKNNKTETDMAIPETYETERHICRYLEWLGYNVKIEFTRTKPATLTLSW